MNRMTGNALLLVVLRPGRCWGQTGSPKASPLHTRVVPDRIVASTVVAEIVVYVAMVGFLSLSYIFLFAMPFLIYLLPVGASLCETGLTTGGLAQHDIAVPTEHDRLGVTEDCGNLEASRTFDVHKEGIGGLHQPLQLVCA